MKAKAMTTKAVRAAREAWGRTEDARGKAISREELRAAAYAVYATYDVVYAVYATYDAAYAGRRAK
jgi:hypothetical protein